MNKKVLLFIFLLLGCLFTASAQEVSSRGLNNDEVDYGQPNKTYNTYKTTWKKNRFKDNWIFTIGGGIQSIFGEDDSKGDSKNRITFAPQISIGKYFSPIWGLRLNITGGSLHGFNDGRDGVYRKWNHGSKHYMGKGFVDTPGYPTGGESTNMFTWDPQWNYLGFTLNNPDLNKSIVFDDHNGTYRWLGADYGNVYMQHIRYFQVNLDFMFDLFNLIGDYNEKRFFEITPFGGIGIYNALSNLGSDNYLTAGVHAGLMVKFRLSERFGLNAEFSGSLVPDDFDGQSGDDQNLTGIGQTTLSLSYKVGKTNWEVSEPMDYELLRTLNDQINDLKIQNQALIDKPCPTCPPPPPIIPITPTTEIKFLPDPVFFRIDKSIIDATEWAKIDKAAQYLNEHPDVNVVVTGYADKKTAYPEYNMKLSERRSKTVSQALIEKYGINPLRVSINWSGDQIQPFKINEWNRVVIFVIE